MRTSILLLLLAACEIQSPNSAASQALCPPPDGIHCCPACPPSVPHGGSSCLDGFCDTSCSAGWADCDGVLSNGCETSLNTNSNCGACHKVCSVGQTCESGACVPTSCPSGERLCASTCIPSTGCCVAGDCVPRDLGASYVCYNNQCFYHCNLDTPGMLCQ